MPNTNNPIDSVSTLPSLAALQRRRRQLLGLQSWQGSPQLTAPLDEQEPECEEQGEQPSNNGRGPEDPPRAEAYGPPSSRASAPPTWADPALYGLAGRVVRSLAPHSEADPAAILLQFLAAFGNLVGPAPHCLVGSSRHGLNLFVVLVGESSKARKGTSWRQICHLFSEVDDLWGSRRVTTAR